MQRASSVGWGGLFCLLASAASSAAPEVFTLSEALEAVTAARAGHDAVTAPGAPYVTWIDGGQLRVALEPEFKPRTLVPDGVTAVYASTDGKTILYLRGSKLWQIEARHGAPHLVADAPKGLPEELIFGANAPPKLAFAPRGEAFAFAEDRMLYEFRRGADGKWARRQLLQPEAQHLASTGIEEIVYSPDGARIAFVSARKARQRYVAIHDIASKQTRYLQPSVFRDGLPAWSPDGTELVFVREPGNWTLTYRFTPRREGVPWSLMAADAKSGAVRTVWTADRGAGSVPRTFAPIWTGDGRILFSWEKTGWNLLYAVPARGGAATLLTPGEGEVSDPVLSPDGRAVVYEANIGDLARRHLWRIDLGHSQPPDALTPGDGVERAPRFTAGGHLIYRADYPLPGLRVHGKGSALELRGPATWKNFQPSQVVSVPADDGLVSSHLVIKPNTPPPSGGYPVVVNAHGGPDIQALHGAALSPSAFAFGQYLVSRGYLHVEMNYRGSTGFGLAYRLAEGAGATGGSEVKDLAALARYLKGRGDVNPKAIGIMGGSYGGHIVSLAMSRLPDDYAAGASLVGVADWVVELKKDQEDQGGMSAPPPYIRLSELDRIEELAFESSPTSHIAQWRGPALFTVGELDRAGHMESTIDLSYRLMERGVPVEIHVDPAGGHRLHALPQVFDFFERYLR